MLDKIYYWLGACVFWVCIITILYYSIAYYNTVRKQRIAK
jgi:hypothetical protein